MAINIQNIISALEAKVASATSATETQELIVIIKSIKAAGQQTIVTYATVSNLPAASNGNIGNLAYVAENGKIYYSNGTAWSQIGGSSLNAGSGITLVTETDGSVTISSTGGTGGTAYDQSLNTTDDVVFNSALVGNVSIIDNTLSASDPYGQSSTLIVDGGLDVNIGSVSTFIGNSSQNFITLQLYSYDVSFFIQNSTFLNQDFVRGLYNNDPDSSPVVTVTLSGGGYSDTVITGKLSPANQGFGSGVWGQSNDPSTISTIYFDTNYLNEITINGIPVTSHPNYNTNYTVGQQVTFTTGSISTPLSVTSSGVNVSNINSSTDLAVTIDTTNTVTNTVTAFSGPIRWYYDNNNPSNIVSYLNINNDLSSNFKAGMKITAWLDSAGQKGSQVTFTLSSDMAYSMNRGGYVSNTVEINPYNTTVDLYPEIITSVTTGGVADYSFSTEGVLTTPMVATDSALIGNISIIDNQIAVEDSYGLPGTLNVSASDVVFDSNINLSVDTALTTTETITDSGNMNQFTIRSGNPGTPQFTYSPMSGSSWSDAPKFKTGTIVSVTDPMYGTKVIRLTSDMTYDNMMDMRWEAGYTTISDSFGGSSDFRSYSVTITNESGAAANYGFNDQGVFTSPTVSTNNLLINGSPAGLLEINSETSKSVVIDTFVSNTETINASGASSFYLNSTNFRYGAPSDWTGANKFLKDAIVTMSYFGQTSVIKLTSNMYYQMGDWIAPYTLISGPNNGIGPVSSVTVTTESGVTVNYDFTDSGFVAESALIGDVSIIDNEIAVEDSYGLPGTLNVSASDIVIKSNLDLTIDSRDSTTETITDSSNMNQFTIRSGSPGTPQFTYSPNEGSSWADAPKFKTGSIVRVTDGMYGTKVIRLTSDMTYDNMMDMRWEAGYTTISENQMFGNSDYRSYSVTVTNESGGVANYGFNDQGVLSTKSLLVDGVSPAFLVVNQDGTKSVNVDSTEVTTYAGDMSGSDPTKVYWSSGQWTTSSSGYGANKFVFSSVNQKTIDVLNLLVAGDKITFGRYDMAMMGVRYTTLTVVSYNYDSMNNVHIITTVETNTEPGMGTDFSSSYGLTIESAVVRDYLFDADGAFTTNNIIAETALLGDVSVVANTISATNSYGNADTLIVDGGLDVITESTSTVEYFYGSPAASGQWDGNISWNGTTLSWNNPTGASLTRINELKAGDTVKFEDSMNVGSFVTVTLTSTMTYDFTSMAYVATVVENNNTGMGISAANSAITITSIIEKTSSFDSNGLTVDGVVNSNAFKVVGDDGSGNQPTALIAAGSLLIAADDNDYASRTYISPTITSKLSVLPNTLADGVVITREAISKLTDTTNTSYSIPVQAATLNGDISIIEVVVSAININTGATPNSIRAKSWKLRGYATKLDNTTSFTQIGTTEILADTDTDPTPDTASLSVSLSGTSGITLNISSTSANTYTWGGEITVNTTHVLVASAGGGGGK